MSKHQTYNDLMRLAEIAVRRMGKPSRYGQKRLWSYDELTVSFEKNDLSKKAPYIKRLYISAGWEEVITVWFNGQVVSKSDDCTEPLALIREAVTVLDELADV